MAMNMQIGLSAQQAGDDNDDATIDTKRPNESAFNTYITTTDSTHNAEVAYAGSKNYVMRADIGKYPVFATPYSSVFSIENVRVLEIGCGNGQFWEYAAPLLTSSAQLILTDNSPLMLDECQKRMISLSHTYPITKLSYQQININLKLPFADEVFNCIIGHNVIYHADDPKSVIHDCYRVLKPGGTLGLSSMADAIESELYSLGQTIDSRVPSKTFTEHCNVSKLRTYLLGFFDKKTIVETSYLGGRNYKTAEQVTEMFCSQPDIQKLKLTPSFWQKFSASIDKVMQDGDKQYHVDLGMTLFTCRKG